MSEQVDIRFDPLIITTKSVTTFNGDDFTKVTYRQRWHRIKLMQGAMRRFEEVYLFTFKNPVKTTVYYNDCHDGPTIIKIGEGDNNYPIEVGKENDVIDMLDMMIDLIEGAYIQAAIDSKERCNE